MNLNFDTVYSGDIYFHSLLTERPGEVKHEQVVYCRSKKKKKEEEQQQQQRTITASYSHILLKTNMKLST